MQLLGLIVFSLMLVPASNKKGEKWSITVTKNMTADKGSDITIPCSFTYPSKYHSDNVIIYWKKEGRSICSKNDIDKNAFIYHPNETCVPEEYRGKTMLVGDKTKGDCSLRFLNITNSEHNIYVRVSAGDNYSFIHSRVSIFVKGSNIKPVTPNPLGPDITDALTSFTIEDTTMGITIEETWTPIYTGIFVPLVTLVIICLVAGIVFFTKRKRAQTLTRQESGYYVNFNRASSNPPRELCPKKDMEHPAPKVIDDPVYANVQNPAGQMDQNMDSMDNIYVNVDYSK